MAIATESMHLFDIQSLPPESLRIRINRRDGALWVFLDVRDDGLATPRLIRRGNGLRGMRDRVLALNGAISLRPLNPGLRLHLLVRQGLVLQRRPAPR